MWHSILWSSLLNFGRFLFDFQLYPLWQIAEGNCCLHIVQVFGDKIDTNQFDILWNDSKFQYQECFIRVIFSVLRQICDTGNISISYVIHSICVISRIVQSTPTVCLAQLLKSNSFCFAREQGQSMTWY